MSRTLDGQRTRSDDLQSGCMGGGRCVLADVSGDGVTDLVQVAKMPRESRLPSAMLVGSVDAYGLRFSQLDTDTRN